MSDRKIERKKDGKNDGWKKGGCNGVLEEMRRGGQRRINGDSEARRSPDQSSEKAIIFLCKDDVINLNSFVLRIEYENTGTLFSSVVINDGVLEGIVEGQNLQIFGHDPYPTLREKAAFLLVNLAHYQCFAEGNKRTAWETCRTFLGLNGIGIYYDSVVATSICGGIPRKSELTTDYCETESWVAAKIKEVAKWIRENSFTSSLDYVPRNK